MITFAPPGWQPKRSISPSVKPPRARICEIAGAILASGLLELGQYVTKNERKQYIDAAQKMLQSLSSDAYKAKPGTNGGFILQHSVGAIPLNSEVDVPLTYADYYFIEALLRYKKWYL